MAPIYEISDHRGNKKGAAAAFNFLNKFRPTFVALIGLIAIILLLMACPAIGKDKPRRVLKVKLVADQYYGKQAEWERRAASKLMDIAGEVTELLKIDMEITGFELWERGTEEDLYHIAAAMVDVVDPGDADAIIGFTYGPCPEGTGDIHTDGVTIPFRGMIIRHYSPRCPRNWFIPYVMLHEMVHLFGGVHVFDNSLMSPVFADTINLRLDPLNRQIIRLTNDIDFKKGYSSLDASTLTKLTTLYEQALEMGNNDVTTFYELASLYLEMAEYDKALAISGCAVKKDSTFTEAWLQMGQSFSRRGTPRVAISILKSSLNHADRKGRIYEQLVRLYFDSHDLENAYHNAVLAEKHGIIIDSSLWKKIRPSPEKNNH
jgi:tetratricopeptide (TPR) repeat protein